MAEFSPVLPPLRDDGGGGRYGQPLFPRSRSGSESDSELSQSLARTKTRSYGSTASVTAPLGETYIEHRVTDGDTLQGIALKYGVTVSLTSIKSPIYKKPFPSHLHTYSTLCILLEHHIQAQHGVRLKN